MLVRTLIAALFVLTPTGESRLATIPNFSMYHRRVSQTTWLSF